MVFLFFLVTTLFSSSCMWSDTYHFTTVESRIKRLLHCTSVPTLEFVPAQPFHSCETQEKEKPSSEVHSFR